jgi:hypothetical protein
MVPESRLESTEHGLVPTGDGWFVLNAREARWRDGPGLAAISELEGQERPLRRWDFVHGPAGTKHVIVGAGEGTCVVLAIGARDRSTGPGWGSYSVDETALRHGAGVEQETTDAKEAYARFPRRQPERYHEGWLPE